MDCVFIEYRRLEFEELEAEEALDAAQFCMVELLNETKGWLWWVRKQKALAKEHDFKLAGVFSDELESEEPLGGSQGVPLADIVLDWVDINFGKLGVFDFGDIVIESAGSAGGS